MKKNPIPKSVHLMWVLISRCRLNRKIMEWISTDKKNPERGEFVLICIRKDVILKGRLMNNGWTALFIDGEGLVETEPVKYWMPLPEPPKE